LEETLANLPRQQSSRRIQLWIKKMKNQDLIALEQDKTYPVDELKYNIKEESIKYKNASRAYIFHVLKQKNLTATSLARMIGVSPSSITRALDENMDYHISPFRLYHIYKFTHIPLPKDLAEMFINLAVDQVSKDVLSSLSDIPILRILQHGGFEIVDHVDRTLIPTLKGRSAFGVYVQDDKMEPVLKAGHLVFADTARLSKLGDDVVVRLKANNVEIYRLMDINEDVYIFKTFQPNHLIKLDKDEVNCIGPIVMIDRTA
jgi:DNA-binding transcriptional ArsR family regulator